jgi:hypothetical protein
MAKNDKKVVQTTIYPLVRIAPFANSSNAACSIFHRKIDMNYFVVG